ncbi:MAG: phosphoribosylaminoimidazolesuccinocarboxamide synthase [archaeon]
MTKEKVYKKVIADNLENVLASGFIPELGEHKAGKVRDVHFKGDNLIMVASDRVSAFDHVLPTYIPFKGMILNLFNQWAMKNSTDIIPNASLPSPDPNVIIQRNLKNTGIECVVRGYVWGSLAGDYEKGTRTKCGIRFPAGMLQYQKLEAPIFTPTTKAEKGHDEDVDFEFLKSKLGEEIAVKVRDASIALFNRGVELAERAKMLFIDTKYEFGTDEAGNLFLIDEANTPDSSRFCDAGEYATKFSAISAAMKGWEGTTVSDLLKGRPDLKIREESKQYVRDVLIAGGYKEGQSIPALTPEQVIETAWRYIESYERLTGKRFDFSIAEIPAKKRIMMNLVKAGLAYGGCVVPMGASEKDGPHWEKLEKALKEAKVPYTQPFYKSAHKNPEEVISFVRMMDQSIEPIVYISFAGRSNGHGPIVCGVTQNPVIANPVFSDTAAYMVDIHSSLRMPSGMPLMTIVDPGNAALAAKRIIDLAR